MDSSGQIASNAGRHHGYAAQPTEQVFLTDIPWPRSNGSEAMTSSTRLQNAGVPEGSVERLMIRNSSPPQRDRKSTRLNSSHLVISYAVFCLKKKKNILSCIHLHCTKQLNPPFDNAPCGVPADKAFA